MALAKCGECRNPVSTKAAACPQCGAPVRNKKTGRGLVFWMLIAVIGICWLMSNKSGGNVEPVGSAVIAANAPTNGGMSAAQEMLAEHGLPSFTKPMFTEEGQLFCNTEENLYAATELVVQKIEPTDLNTPGCHVTKPGVRLFDIGSGSAFSFQEHVRMLHADGSSSDGWMSLYGITNDPDQLPPARSHNVKAITSRAEGSPPKIPELGKDGNPILLAVVKKAVLAMPYSTGGPRPGGPSCYASSCMVELHYEERPDPGVARRDVSQLMEAVLSGYAAYGELRDFVSISAVIDVPGQYIDRNDANDPSNGSKMSLRIGGVNYIPELKIYEWGDSQQSTLQPDFDRPPITLP